MKSFANSNFHDVATSKKVGISFLPNSNQTVIGYTENGEIKQVPTDMMYSDGLRVFIRIIMNVQLMNFSIIDTVTDLIRGDVEKFIDKELKPNGKISDEDDIISFSGPKYTALKGKQITSWINVDIPYVEKRLKDINILINKIVDIYRSFCEQQEIYGKDVFYICKYVVKTSVHFCDESLSAVMFANYQKPNSYVKTIGTFINLPEFVNIDFRNIDKAVGCDLCVQRNGGVDQEIESIFDDRFRICELNVQRIIQKDEKFSVAHFASRTISIYKRDKNNALISRDAADGSIRVNSINISITEHAKITTVLAEYIENFFKMNCRLHPSISKVVSSFVKNGVIKQITNKFAAVAAAERKEKVLERDETPVEGTEEVPSNLNDSVEDSAPANEEV